MPEVPEIIMTTQYLNTKLKNKKIIDITIISGRYTHQVLQGINLLKNNTLTIKNVNSKGKLIWFDTKDKHNKNIYLINTLGMTGMWSFDEGKNDRVKFTIYSNIDKTKELYFSDQRNFGTIVITDDITILNKRINKLAPDILRSNITDIQLLELIKQYISKSRSNKNIVKVLMNQNAIISGIGNYLVAEILYDAKISPFRDLNKLTTQELIKLAHSIRKITKFAYYDNITDYMAKFKGFIKSHSKKNIIFPDYLPDIVGKKFKFNVYQLEKDLYGNIVQKDEIVKDRTIHWVPNVQV